MHRRDYVLIAKVLQKSKECPPDVDANDVVNNIISNFCSALKEENHSFNEQKFRDYIEKGK